MKKNILILIILSSIQSFGQNIPLGYYSNEKDFISLNFTDNINVEMILPSGPDCGTGFSVNGNYKIENKELVLNYDYSFPEYQAEFDRQKFVISELINNKKQDSIILNIEVVDVESEMLFGEYMNVKVNNRTYKLNFDGKASLNIPANTDTKIEIQAYSSAVLDTTYFAKNDADIKIVFNPYLIDEKKKHKIKYEIIEINKSSLVLKDNNDKVMYFTKRKK